MCLGYLPVHVLSPWMNVCMSLVFHQRGLETFPESPSWEVAEPEPDPALSGCRLWTLRLAYWVRLPRGRYWDGYSYKWFMEVLEDTPSLPHSSPCRKKKHFGTNSCFLEYGYPNPILKCRWVERSQASAAHRGKRQITWSRLGNPSAPSCKGKLQPAEPTLSDNTQLCWHPTT